MSSLSIKLISELSKASAITEIERSTTRDKKRIRNDDLLAKIKRAEPMLKLKSDSITKAVELWSIHTFTAKIPLPVARRLLAVLNKLIPILFTKAGGSGQQSTYQRIRKAIISSYGRTSTLVDASYKTMRYDQKAWREERTAYSKKIAAANKTARPVTTIDAIDKSIQIGLDSDKWQPMSIAAELASGSRVVEILSLSSFKPAVKEHYIIQTGVAKKTSNGDTTTITKPILGMTVKQFIDLIKRLRAALPDTGLSGYALSQKLNYGLNKYVKRSLPGIKGSHDLRKLYAARAWKEYGVASGQSEAGYFGQVLGHNPDSLDVAASYTTRSVKGAGDITIDGLKAEIVRLEAIIAGLSIKKGGFLSLDDLSGIAKNSKKRDGKVGERIAESAEQLETAGKPVTVKYLRALGYGSSTISKFMKTKK